ASVQSAAKIDLISCSICRIKTNDKGLPGFDRRDEFDRSYAGEPGLFAPLGQSGGDFIKNQDARHDWGTGKMTRQAGMIGGNNSGSFEGHRLRIYRYVIPNVSRDYTVAGDERECSGSTESRPTNRRQGGFWWGNALRSRKLRAFAEECLPVFA